MDFIKQTFNEFSKDRCSTLAAALAYYTIFALPPLLYLLLTLITLGLSAAYDSEQAEEKARGILERQAAQMLGNEAATEEISAILENNQQAGGKWWKTLLSFAGIIAGATGVVAALQDSLNRVWSVQLDPESSGIMNVILKRVLSFGMILGLGFLLLVSLVVSTVLNGVGERLGLYIGMDDSIGHLINYGVQTLVIFTIFAAIFRFMPDVRVGWRDVAVGAAVTTVLFLLGRFGLEFYLSKSDPGAQLGSAAASLAVILVWVYYSAMILLFGAEVTQVYATRIGGGIVPQKNAVRVVESIERPGQA